MQTKDRAESQRTAAHVEGVLTDYDELKRRCGLGDYNACDSVLTLQQALDQAGMTDKQAEALRLYYFGGYEQAEIGEMVGAERSVVARRIRAAIDKVTKYYEGHRAYETYEEETE